MSTSPANMLRARLKDTTLGDILGHLHRMRASGVLELDGTNGTSARVLVVDGSPTMVLGDDGAPLGHLLAISTADRDAALDRQREGDPRLLGEILEEFGADPASVAEAVRKQTKDRLESLFQLRDGTVRFRAAMLENERLRRWFRAGPRGRRLSPREVLEGRARARNDARMRDASFERQRALAVLGLSGNADLDAVRGAFRKSVSAMHPDRATSEEDRQRRTAAVARLSAAYHKLVG